MATLSEKVEMLRAQLGLSPDLNMVAVVDQALEQLGLEATGSLIVKADACVQAIGRSSFRPCVEAPGARRAPPRQTGPRARAC